MAGGIAIQVIGEGGVSSARPVPGFWGTTKTRWKGPRVLANGILGVGPFVQDCGPACATAGSGNPGVYFACSSGAPEVVWRPRWPPPAQVSNPVARLPPMTTA